MCEAHLVLSEGLDGELAVAGKSRSAPRWPRQVRRLFGVTSRSCALTLRLGRPGRAKVSDTVLPSRRSLRLRAARDSSPRHSLRTAHTCSSDAFTWKSVRHNRHARKCGLSSFERPVRKERRVLAPGRGMALDDRRARAVRRLDRRTRRAASRGVGARRSGCMPGSRGARQLERLDRELTAKRRRARSRLRALEPAIENRTRA